MTQPSPEDIAKFVPPPDDNLVIWRYMDFTKFVALLETASLFFPRVSILDDPFEGSFPASQTPFRRVIEMLPPGAVPPGAAIHFSQGLDGVWGFMRQWAMVSCWHASPHESAAMWRLYASTHAAVAIRSTVARLRASLGSPGPPPSGFFGGDRFHIGEVEYIDFSSDRIPAGSFAAQFFRKRQSFEHEREIRVLLLQYPVTSERQLDYKCRPDSPGKSTPVDLSALVEGILIAPQAPQWYAALVGKMATRYELAVTPQQSELDAEPMY